MKKLQDKKFLRTVRATWLSEKLDMNYARVNAILNKSIPATPNEKRKISKAISKEKKSFTHGHKKAKY